MRHLKPQALTRLPPWIDSDRIDSGYTFGGRKYVLIPPYLPARIRSFPPVSAVEVWYKNRVEILVKILAKGSSRLHQPNQLATRTLPHRAPEPTEHSEGTISLQQQQSIELSPPSHQRYAPHHQIQPPFRARG